MNVGRKNVGILSNKRRNNRLTDSGSKTGIMPYSVRVRATEARG